MTTWNYEPIFVSEIPRKLEEGYLYIAIEYGAVIHLCPCGCKSEISTPLNRKTGWIMKYDGEFVSLYPSIGNYSYACKSHYFIRDNKVVWANGNNYDIDYRSPSKRSYSILRLFKYVIVKVSKFLK